MCSPCLFLPRLPVDGRHVLPGNSISFLYFGDTLHLKVASVSPVWSPVLEQSSAASPPSERAGDLSDSHDIGTKFSSLSMVDVSGVSEGDSSQLLTDESGTDVSELASVDAIKTVFRIRARTKVTFDLELEGLTKKQVGLAYCLATHW